MTTITTTAPEYNVILEESSAVIAATDEPVVPETVPVYYKDVNLGEALGPLAFQPVEKVGALYVAAPTVPCWSKPRPSH